MANLKSKAIVVLLTFQVAVSKPAKTPNHVYEVIEPARTDDKKPSNTPGILPYGNPLAGNSLQNAKLHAQNQQAMFNAERIRQHRAQLQRWTKAPQQIDSYMKAYHESQESHQLALEQEQAKLKDKKSSSKRQENLKHSKGPDPMKITKEDAVTKTENVRNHRSYGSVEYQQYLEPRRYKTVFVSPGPTYDQGVTINPNGITFLEPTEPSKLYTEAIASKSQHFYPKQYSQSYYQSSNDIAALNALLTKTPQEQLSEFNAMLQSNSKVKDTDGALNLYYYLKQKKINEKLEEYAQVQVPTYATYTSGPEDKDHTPISEVTDEVEDPNKQTTLAYTAPTAQTLVGNTGSYFTAGEAIEPEAVLKSKPVKQTLTQEKPVFMKPTPKTPPMEVYLHQNAKPTGVQRLNQDGVGVSAYSEDDLQYAANYEFGYRVRDQQTGNDFGHQEATKNGKTSGHYHVLLPDGRMQKVKYSAGPSGFHADISYDHLA